MKMVLKRVIKGDELLKLINQSLSGHPKLQERVRYLYDLRVRPSRKLSDAQIMVEIFKLDPGEEPNLKIEDVPPLEEEGEINLDDGDWYNIGNLYFEVDD